MSRDSSITAAAEGSAAPASAAGSAVPTAPDDGSGVVVYRTRQGWRVGEDDLPDLVNAMVFADLLAGDLPSSTRPRGHQSELAQSERASPEHGQSEKAQSQQAPSEQTQAQSEQTQSEQAQLARLRTTISQLEHALANRVRVEQAIGALAERHRLLPRQAFDLLRSAARSRGRRVAELAEEVVAGITNPLLPVADELARPPKPSRSRGRSRQA